MDFTKRLTGTFNHGTVDENSTLYDSSTDTIYIYNDYQLKIIQSDNSENEPVMSQDMLPECVGMGQPVYSDNSSNYLTYSKSHNYVLSKNFTGEMPETKANQISNMSTENCEGRDFNGQVVKTIGDKTYILIGNEEQLRKIGSDETVYGAVYQVYLHAANWYVDEDENGNPIMLYGGDADLKNLKMVMKILDLEKRIYMIRIKNKVNIVCIHIYGEDAESINLLVKLIQHWI